MKRIYQCTICLGVFFMIIFQSFSIFAEEPRAFPQINNQEGGEAYFNSARNQTAIQSGKSLSNLAMTHTSIGEDPVSYGFAAKSDEAKFFIIGTLYSEALAHLRSGNSSMAANRLEAIEKQFIALQVSPSLYNYVSKTRNLIESSSYSTEALIDMLSFFQPFFEDYAKRQNQDKLILFRAGSWLVDMSLTAAANDKQLIKQGKRQMVYFINEMRRMDAPKGVLESLERIDKIAGKDEIEEKDVERVLKQVKKIQMILG